MSLQLVRAVAVTELSDDLHLGRLLILLKSAGGRSGIKPVAGITKLAKMDFLLRYPNCLERVLQAVELDPANARIKPYEKNTIETKMIRFRYGPWDSRYRRWMRLLQAKGLGTTHTQGNTVYIGLTERGAEFASTLAKDEEFRDISERSKLVAKAVGDMSASRLKDFIYEQFPEITTMRWGEEIEI
jgi:hypothetical protein